MPPQPATASEAALERTLGLLLPQSMPPGELFGVFATVHDGGGALRGCMGRTTDGFVAIAGMAELRAMAAGALHDAMYVDRRGAGAVEQDRPVLHPIDYLTQKRILQGVKSWPLLENLGDAWFHFHLHVAFLLWPHFFVSSVSGIIR